MRTITDRPLRMLVTRTFVPKGSVRCAAVNPFGPDTSPLAVRPPRYYAACPVSARAAPSGPTKANEITAMAKPLMVMVHQYHGTDRAVRLASQPIPMFSEFASYTDY